MQFRLHSVDIAALHTSAETINIEVSDRAAIERRWTRLTLSRLVIADNYGWVAHHLQRESLDQFARGAGVEFLLLPAGQGMLIKP